MYHSLWCILSSFLLCIIWWQHGTERHVKAIPCPLDWCFCSITIFCCIAFFLVHLCTAQQGTLLKINGSCCCIIHSCFIATFCHLSLGARKKQERRCPLRSLELLAFGPILHKAFYGWDHKNQEKKCPLPSLEQPHMVPATSSIMVLHISPCFLLCIFKSLHVSHEVCAVYLQ